MEVCIEYGSDTGRLSFSGKGRYGSGQCLDGLLKGKPSADYMSCEVEALFSTWKRWHLNNMRPGTKKQMAQIRKWQRLNRECSYENICQWLKEIDLYEDEGYRYGSGWLKEEVPDDVLNWLFSLPGEGHTWQDILDYRTEDISDESFFSIINRC